MKYTGDLGCRYRGIPHDIITLHENSKGKWEHCKICRKQWHWHKGYMGRIWNTEYLKVHVRNFAQQTGPTKRIYQKIYKPENCKIIL